MKKNDINLFSDHFDLGEHKYLKDKLKILIKYYNKTDDFKKKFNDTKTEEGFRQFQLFELVFIAAINYDKLDLINKRIAALKAVGSKGSDEHEEDEKVEEEEEEEEVEFNREEEIEILNDFKDIIDHCFKKYNFKITFNVEDVEDVEYVKENKSFKEFIESYIFNDKLNSKLYNKILELEIKSDIIKKILEIESLFNKEYPYYAFKDNRSLAIDFLMNKLSNKSSNKVSSYLTNIEEESKLKVRTFNHKDDVIHEGTKRHNKNLEKSDGMLFLNDLSDNDGLKIIMDCINGQDINSCLKMFNSKKDNDIIDEINTLNPFIILTILDTLKVIKQVKNGITVYQSYEEWINKQGPIIKDTLKEKSVLAKYIRLLIASVKLNATILKENIHEEPKESKESRNTAKKYPKTTSDDNSTSSGDELTILALLDKLIRTGSDHSNLNLRFRLPMNSFSFLPMTGGEDPKIKIENMLKHEKTQTWYVFDKLFKIINNKLKNKKTKLKDVDKQNIESLILKLKVDEEILLNILINAASYVPENNTEATITLDDIHQQYIEKQEAIRSTQLKTKEVIDRIMDKLNNL